jgi:hypothetical protein
MAKKNKVVGFFDKVADVTVGSWNVGRRMGERIIRKAK